MEPLGQTLETFPLLAQEWGTIKRGWVSIAWKRTQEICAKLSGAILWLVEKVTSWTGLQIVINEAALCHAWCQKPLFSVLGCGVGDLAVRTLSAGGTAHSHWWVWGAQGTSVAFAFCIPMAIQAQISLSLLCWLIQTLCCKQGPENLLYTTRTIPNYASLGALPLKENLFWRHCWLDHSLQRVIFHVKVGVAPPFLCAWLFLKPALSQGHMLSHVHCFCRAHSQILNSFPHCMQSSLQNLKFWIFSLPKFYLASKWDIDNKLAGWS